MGFAGAVLIGALGGLVVGYLCPAIVKKFGDQTKAQVDRTVEDVKDKVSDLKSDD